MGIQKLGQQMGNLHLAISEVFKNRFNEAIKELHEIAEDEEKFYPVLAEKFNELKKVSWELKYFVPLLYDVFEKTVFGFIQPPKNDLAYPPIPAEVDFKTNSFKVFKKSICRQGKEVSPVVHIQLAKEMVKAMEETARKEIVGMVNDIVDEWLEENGKDLKKEENGKVLIDTLKKYKTLLITKYADEGDEGFRFAKNKILQELEEKKVSESEIEFVEDLLTELKDKIEAGISSLKIRNFSDLGSIIRTLRKAELFSADPTKNLFDLDSEYPLEIIFSAEGLGISLSDSLDEVDSSPYVKFEVFKALLEITAKANIPLFLPDRYVIKEMTGSDRLGIDVIAYDLAIEDFWEEKVNTYLEEKFRKELKELVKSYPNLTILPKPNKDRGQIFFAENVNLLNEPLYLALERLNERVDFRVLERFKNPPVEPSR